MYCSCCGKEILDEINFCPECGNKLNFTNTEQHPNSVTKSIKHKSKGIAVLLLLLLGGIGAHRFYLDEVGAGIAFFIGGILAILLSSLVVPIIILVIVLFADLISLLSRNDKMFE